MSDAQTQEEAWQSRGFNDSSLVMVDVWEGRQLLAAPGDSAEAILPKRRTSLLSLKAVSTVELRERQDVYGIPARADTGLNKGRVHL